MASGRDMERLRDEVEELFADLWQLPRFTGARRGFRPPIDCFRTDDPPGIVVVVDLAGVEPGDVQVVVDHDTLLVTGERRHPAAEGRHYQQMEIERGSFERRVPLGRPVDIESASASYERGLLTVVLPPAARTPPSAKVAIRVRTHR